MSSNDTHSETKVPEDAQRKPYTTPVLTTYGDVVEQTLRGHSGADKNRKSLGK
jgi:hypothetical protein